MADRIERFEILVPAGTTKAAPQTTAMSINDGIVARMEILVPPGPSGLAGFRIVHSGQVVIPFAGTTWIISDNFTHEWDLSNYPTGDKWSFRAHNTDVYDHTFYVTMFVNEIPISLAPQRLLPLTPSFGASADLLPAA